MFASFSLVCLIYSLYLVESGEWSFLIRRSSILKSRQRHDPESLALLERNSPIGDPSDARDSILEVSQANIRNILGISLALSRWVLWRILWKEVGRGEVGTIYKEKSTCIPGCWLL